MRNNLSLARRKGAIKINGAPSGHAVNKREQKTWWRLIIKLLPQHKNDRIT